MTVSGVLNVLKPPGLTSHDVVAYLRKLTGERRAGHTGTLDPLAAGVLPVCLGKATRLAEYLAAAAKDYRAEMILGLTTDSGDTEGHVLSRRDAGSIRAPELERALAAFRGEIRQVPPALSAVKVDGLRSYQRVRQGIPVEPTVRTVAVYRLELVEFLPGSSSRARLDIGCSKGTYVRSLCRDIGEALGCGAALGWLLRTRSGRFRLEEAWTLEELAAGWQDALVSPAQAVDHLPFVRVSGMDAYRVRHGQAPQMSVDGHGPVRVLDDDEGLVAMGEVTEGRLKLRKVLV
ncbi:MAG: tRNA pseudouridine(55) synthase TruB [Bacillota bacterium]